VIENVAHITAKCSKCKLIKPCSDFHRAKKYPTSTRNVAYWCRDCVSKFSTLPNTERRYFYDIQRRYGVSKQEFKRLFSEQNGACAICSNKLLVGSQLHVDHCHVTKTVRALLCRDCNKGIGFLKENVGVLKAAIAYLVAHKCKVAKS
jgi:hypothetical protein